MKNLKNAKKIFILILFIFFSNFILSAKNLTVVVTYPYIMDLVQRIGGNSVKVFCLANGEWNPHTIVPKPSYIAKLRQADLLIISGAQLEIGWVPPLINQANNPNVQIGSNGLLDLSKYIKLMDVPSSVSRAQGDIHPDGNPHFYLDPYNILVISKTIADKLSEMNPENSVNYSNNYNQFTNSWNNKLKDLETRMKKFSNINVIEYHKNYDYFLKRYNINIIATIEPLPGIPPTSKHIEELEKKISQYGVKILLQDVYNPNNASVHLSKKYNIKMAVLPHDVGAVREAKDIYSLFDELVRRMEND